MKAFDFQAEIQRMKEASNSNSNTSRVTPERPQSKNLGFVGLTFAARTTGPRMGASVRACSEAIEPDAAATQPVSNGVFV